MQQRYKSYMRVILGSDLPAECHAFLETHYREANVPPSPLAGMPVLEAHELVNKWNRDQYKPKYVFYLQ